MTDTLANIMNPQTMIIILVIVLVLFGGSKIPEIMKGLGSGMKEFKKGMKEDETEVKTVGKAADSDHKTEEVKSA